MKYASDMKEKCKVASVFVICKQLQGIEVLSFIEMFQLHGLKIKSDNVWELLGSHSEELTDDALLGQQ